MLEVGERLVMQCSRLHQAPRRFSVNSASTSRRISLREAAIHVQHGLEVRFLTVIEDLLPAWVLDVALVI